MFLLFRGLSKTANIRYTEDIFAKSNHMSWGNHMIGFIVNPASGNGNGRKVWKKAEDVLKAEQRPCIARWTEKPGDAKAFAREMALRHDCDAIIAVGGDGTLGEAAAGLLEAGARVPLGHLPAGSGNDFARAMGIPPNDVKTLAKWLDAGALQPLDALLIETPGRAGGVAVCSVGAGFDGKVAQVTNRAAYKKWLNRFRLGAFAYFLSVLRVLLTYRPGRVRLTVDGRTFEYENVWLVTVTNIPYFGGGMRICPEAQPGDGLADVCVVHRVNRLEFVRAFPKVYAGRHVSHPGVSFHRGREVHIRSETALAAHADGEFAGETPLEVRVAAGALRVLGGAPGS